MTTMNYHLRSMPAAQAHVEFVHDNHGELVAVHLYSYRTRILEIDRVEKDEGYVWVTNVVYNPAYSRTTARHVNRFTRELFGMNYYYECKHAWQYDHALDELLKSHVIMDFWNEYRQYGKHFHY